MSEGVECPDAERTLAAMILYGWSFGEAVRALCREAMGPRIMEAEMDAAVRAAGHPAGSRRLLEELYRGAMFDEN